MKVILNDESFRYDVHALIKAFYPNEELNYELINSQSVTELENIDISFNKSTFNIFIPSEIAHDRKEAKNIFKRRMYDILSEKTGKSLPWGTLTGIRPVKIPAALLREGLSDKEIVSKMKETYYISDEKCKLALDIAKGERLMLDKVSSLTEKGLTDTASLYIGIPFCPSICAYCSFSSYPVSLYQDKVSTYLSALKRELLVVSEHINKRIATIYIGGGTPSTLSGVQLRDLISFIKSSFDISGLLEFSVECGRPDSITEGKLRALKDEGVDRISINPQSMNDATLKLIGRNHTGEDIIKAFLKAKEFDFKTINCDLIAGLLGEGKKEIEYTLSEIEKLEPQNLTVHALSIKRASRLNLSWEHKPEAIDAKVMELFMQSAEKMGLTPYYLYRQKNISGNLENIGFAKKNLECLYNCLIMGEYHDIIACGSGAVSKFTDGENKPVRVSNVKDVDVYIKRVNEMAERKIQWL